MITISYQTFGNKEKGFQLRLRLYQSGETKFINVTKLLKGAIQKKHWNQKKQLFIPSCPFSDENNAILVQFRQKYDRAAIDWSGTVYGMLKAMEANSKLSQETMTVQKFIQHIVDMLSDNIHPDGTLKGTFEVYQKCDRRLQEFCNIKRTDYSKMPLSELTPAFIDSVFEWVKNSKKGKGKGYLSSMLHSIVSKADKEGYLKLEDYKNCDWHKKKNGSAHKNNTLTEQQCKMFAKMNLREVSRSSMNELYRDFCLFILYTGQSSCDAISLKYSDIQNIGGVNHFVFKRRKIAEKQAVPCAVPINEDMDRIMLRWKHLSKDGYIFPIRNKQKLKSQNTNNGDIKHFISKLNIWLKKVGEVLGCDFPLHTYTFRHTAITYYISKGVPVMYVANMMGTSVSNCEKIYYNNQGDVHSRNKVLAAMKF